MNYNNLTLAGDHLTIASRPRCEASESATAPLRLASATLRHKVSRCSLAPFSVIVGQQCAGFIVRLDLLHQI